MKLILFHIIHSERMNIYIFMKNKRLYFKKAFDNILINYNYIISIIFLFEVATKISIIMLRINKDQRSIKKFLLKYENC